MADDARGPTVRRILLGRLLRDLRERAGLTFEDAAERIYANHNTIRRMEAGESRPNARKLRALLNAYGVSDEDAAEVLRMAEEASQPGWWHHYADALPAWFRTYVGLEESATLIRGYEPQVIPGLFQTADYARAVIAAGVETLSPEEIQRRVDLRLTRQQILTRDNPPRVWFIVEESALRRLPGGRKVMAAQIDRLIELVNTLPHVTIQVMPQQVAHAAMYGAFHHLRLPAELPDIAYIDGLTNAVYLDRPSDVARYAEALDHLSAQAVPFDRTTDTLTRIRKGLR